MIKYLTCDTILRIQEKHELLNKIKTKFHPVDNKTCYLKRYINNNAQHKDQKSLSPPSDVIAEVK